MKFVKKIIIICQVFLILFFSIGVYANEIIDEKEELQKIEYEYYDKVSDTWIYKEEEIKSYTNDEMVKYIIYELEKDGEKIELSTEKPEEILDEEQIEILYKGFPYKSKEELGLDNDISAYIATKLALIWTINSYERDELYNRIREVQEDECNKAPKIDIHENNLVENNIITDVILENNMINDIVEDISEEIEDESEDYNNDIDEEIIEKTEIEKIIEVAYEMLNIEESKSENNENEEEHITEEEELIEKEEDMESEQETDEKEYEEEELKVTQIDFNIQNKKTVSSEDEGKYVIDIRNVGNTEVEEFTFYNVIDSNKEQVTRLQMGTYNQDLKYNVYYKTNLNKEYVLLEEELSTQSNNLVEFENIKLNDNERIEEIKILFNEVYEGFKSVEPMQLYTKVSNLNDNVIITNYGILEGRYNDIKLSKDMEIIETVYNVAKVVKLPKTGY